MSALDDSVRTYVDAIPATQRPLFDRVHRLLLEAQPAATVRMAYRMPTYVFGDRGLHVGVWKHGLSLYGWSTGRDAGFLDRHPDLWTDKGTLRLSPAAAAGITDDELRDFLRAELAP